MTLTKKKKPLNYYKKKCWAVFSRYIRLRDCLKTMFRPDVGRCITCNLAFPFKELQAGHFIQGRHNANLFSERGVNAQCRTCNIIKHGNVLEYRRKMVAMYGEEIAYELEKEAQQIKKFTPQELIELTEYYTKKIKELE